MSKIEQRAREAFLRKATDENAFVLGLLELFPARWQWQKEVAINEVKKILANGGVV